MNVGTEDLLAVGEPPARTVNDRLADVNVSARRRANVLIADDDPASLLAIEAILGDLDQHVSFAHSGEEALKLLLNGEFAVVVLDVRMPGISGYETARYIRERKRTEHTPIIFLTGMGADDGDVFAGYHAGAVDYLTKPVVPHVLRAKVKAFVDLFLASEEVKRQDALLRESERREHQRQLAEQEARFETERLRQEMCLAGRIQRRLFPDSSLAIPGFDIFGESRLAEAAGGDYFDFFPLSGGKLGIAIGDVCGHGIASALTMAATRAYIRALFLGKLCPARVLRLVNRALADDVEDGHFVTLLLAVLNPLDQTIRYAGAGHPPGYVISSSGEVQAILKSDGPALGIIEDADFRQRRHSLVDGDLVLFVTDGITEAGNSRHQLFGMDRVLEVVRANTSQPASTICRELREAALRFRGRTVLDDDATSIVIKVKPENRPAGETPTAQCRFSDRL